MEYAKEAVFIARALAKITDNIINIIPGILCMGLNCDDNGNGTGDEWVCIFICSGFE